MLCERSLSDAEAAAEFDFGVKHAWYYFVENNDFGHLVSISVSIKEKKVTVTGSYSKFTTVTPKVSLMVFASDF